MDCRECRRAYTIGPWDSAAARRVKANGPPCGACFPGVHDDNRDAFEVYQRCQGQWTTTDRGRLISLRAEAVEAVMRVCRIRADERLAVFDQVMALGGQVAGHHNDKLRDSACRT